jgi:DNA-binding SARP family transcriptional activator/streptogramin lyase
MGTSIGSLEYGILGPLQAFDASGPLPVRGAKQRALLAALLLHRDEVVASDRLIDELWGERPPATATKTLQVHVSHLRRTLGDAAIETHERGYRLVVSSGRLDLDRFEALVAEARRVARDGDHGGAAERLREALALWRGPPLAEFAYEPFAAGEIARLEELRLVALEDRIEADLSLGREMELVPELSALVEEHALRERVRAQLMLALYRAGRQADALACYREGCGILREELGLEPGRELQGLERSILAQDPALGRARRQRPPTRLRRRSRAPVVIAAGCILGAAAVVSALIAALGGGGTAPQALLAPGSVASADPVTGRVLKTVAVPGAPSRLAVGGGRVWVGADDSRTVTALDARKGSFVGLATPNAFPTAVALGGGELWLADRGAGSVVEIDPSYRSVVARIPLPRATRLDPVGDRASFDPWSIAAGDAAVWVTDGSRRLFEIDPRRHRVAHVFDLAHALDGVAVGDGQLWAISGSGGLALRVDPHNGRVREQIQIASQPGFRSPYPMALGIGAGSVWVLNGNTATVTRIDPDQRAVSATIPIGV